MEDYQDELLAEVEHCPDCGKALIIQQSFDEGKEYAFCPDPMCGYTES